MESRALCLLEVVWIRKQIFNSLGKKKESGKNFIGIHKACPKEVCKGLIRKEDRMVEVVKIPAEN